MKCFICKKSIVSKRGIVVTYSGVVGSGSVRLLRPVHQACYDEYQRSGVRSRIAPIAGISPEYVRSQRLWAWVRISTFFVLCAVVAVLGLKNTIQFAEFSITEWFVFVAFVLVLAAGTILVSVYNLVIVRKIERLPEM